jgi:protein-S-isoprenylcysteine O-methyltransferase Ste14
VIRHPLYAAACTFGWAGVATHWSWAVAGFGVLLLAGAVGRMLCEERSVGVMYPEHRDYARATKRVLPFAF